MDRCSRYRGALLGLAAGDALGTTLEFKAPGTFQPINDMVGGGPFELKVGQWTDDTSMALCLAESLVKRRRFDPFDQLERYVRWYRDGHMSCTGVLRHRNTTRCGLIDFMKCGLRTAGRRPRTPPGTAASCARGTTAFANGRGSRLAGRR